MCLRQRNQHSEILPNGRDSGDRQHKTDAAGAPMRLRHQIDGEEGTPPGHDVGQEINEPIEWHMIGRRCLPRHAYYLRWLMFDSAGPGSN